MTFVLIVGGENPFEVIHKLEHLSTYLSTFPPLVRQIGYDKSLYFMTVLWACLLSCVYSASEGQYRSSLFAEVEPH